MTVTVDLLGTSLTEGDAASATWTFLNPDGTAFDPTPVTKTWFTLKEAVDDLDAAAVAQYNTVADPSNISWSANVLTVTFANGDTTGMADNQYLYYDIQLLNAGEIQTPVAGRLQFRHEITLATS